MSIKSHILRKVKISKPVFLMEYIVDVIVVIKSYYLTESTASHKPSWLNEYKYLEKEQNGIKDHWLKIVTYC